MKRLGKFLIIGVLALVATSCEVLLPLAVFGTSAASVATAAYIVTNAEPSEPVAEEGERSESHITSVTESGAHTIITKSDGSTTTIVDHGAHKFIHKSDGTTSTVIDHGAHKIIHNSDGSTSTVVDHGAHKIVISPDGTHQVIVVP